MFESLLAYSSSFESESKVIIYTYLQRSASLLVSQQGTPVLFVDDDPYPVEFENGQEAHQYLAVHFNCTTDDITLTPSPFFSPFQKINHGEREMSWALYNLGELVFTMKESLLYRVALRSREEIDSYSSGVITWEPPNEGNEGHFLPFFERVPHQPEWLTPVRDSRGLFAQFLTEIKQSRYKDIVRQAPHEDDQSPGACQRMYLELPDTREVRVKRVRLAGAAGFGYKHIRYEAGEEQMVRLPQTEHLLNKPTRFLRDLVVKYQRIAWESVFALSDEHDPMQPGVILIPYEQYRSEAFLGFNIGKRIGVRDNPDWYCLGAIKSHNGESFAVLLRLKQEERGASVRCYAELRGLILGKEGVRVQRLAAHAGISNINVKTIVRKVDAPPSR